jgi:hypothetical protein
MIISENTLTEHRDMAGDNCIILILLILFILLYIMLYFYILL